MTQPDTPTVIVTGASRGIGRAVVIELARQGVSVVAVARSAELLESLLAELPGTGHRTAAFDVRDEAGWADLAASLDRIDGVVAAAATQGPIGRIDQVDWDQVKETFDVNVLGSILAVRAATPRLALSGGSVVLFSGGGSDPIPGYDAYVASKAAVVRLAENLAAELAGIGVRVNAVAPGFVATEIHQATLQAGPDRAGAEYYQRTIQTLSEGGFPASEAAELVSFLISPDSAPLTGRLISARWDPWRDATWRAQADDSPELFSMRRIDDVLFAKRKA